MPAVSPKLIVNELIDAIQQSGGVAAYVSSSDRTHPRKFSVGHLSNTYSLWAYVWTLTHGGRTSLPDEYRIQMTAVKSPLQMNPSGLTVLMGFHPGLKVFAGFDLRKHSAFTPGSPSVQVDISALYSALQNGLSFMTKDNDEIAIGVRPDQFLNYCLNAGYLHRYGAESKFLELLTKAVELHPVSDEDLSALSATRQRIVHNVNRYSRDANFRKVVLSAYDNRCAVTRSQMRLVEAAHILPVASPDSCDHVANGIALSPTLHRAYDNCLIYLDEDYTMRLNTEKANELNLHGLDGGIPDLCLLLNRQIHLPAVESQRPNMVNIRRANRLRRIPGYT